MAMWACRRGERQFRSRGFFIYGEKPLPNGAKEADVHSLISNRGHTQRCRGGKAVNYRSIRTYRLHYAAGSLLRLKKSFAGWDMWYLRDAETLRMAKIKWRGQGKCAGGAGPAV